MRRHDFGGERHEGPPEPSLRPIRDNEIESYATALYVSAGVPPMHAYTACLLVCQTEPLLRCFFVYGCFV